MKNRGKTVRVPFCPECAGDIPGVDVSPNLIVVCPGCAAIVIYDAKDRGFRPLLTEEWWPIRARPEWYDLCERRIQTLDAITAPPA